MPYAHSDGSCSGMRKAASSGSPTHPTGGSSGVCHEDEADDSYLHELWDFSGWKFGTDFASEIMVQPMMPRRPAEATRGLPGAQADGPGRMAVVVQLRASPVDVARLSADRELRLQFIDEVRNAVALHVGDARMSKAAYSVNVSRDDSQEHSWFPGRRENSVLVHIEAMPAKAGAGVKAMLQVRLAQTQQLCDDIAQRLRRHGHLAEAGVDASVSLEMVRAAHFAPPQADLVAPPTATIQRDIAPPPLEPPLQTQPSEPSGEAADELPRRATLYDAAGILQEG